MKEFEWFEWFEWFGPSPIEPFNSGRYAAVVARVPVPRVEAALLAVLPRHPEVHLAAGLREGRRHPVEGLAAHAGPELKGSIGEGSNHSNFSDHSSVKIAVRILEISLEFIRNSKISAMLNTF